MKIVRTLALLIAGVGLSACASVNTVTRGAPFEEIPQTPASSITVPQPDAAETVAVTRATDALDSLPSPEAAAPVRINNVLVTVPRSLRVSEANRYLPAGDIVWRGDPMGDRYAQVQAIFEEAMVQGARTVTGDRPVDLLITVTRFHALTEKARYSVGGVHNIVFDMALADPETGAILVPWQEVRADLEAYGGRQAIEADARGETQKKRITAHLARVIEIELTTPEGYQNADLGLFQALNQL